MAADIGRIASQIGVQAARIDEWAPALLELFPGQMNQGLAERIIDLHAEARAIATRVRAIPVDRMTPTLARAVLAAGDAVVRTLYLPRQIAQPAQTSQAAPVLQSAHDRAVGMSAALEAAVVEYAVAAEVGSMQADSGSLRMLLNDLREKSASRMTALDADAARSGKLVGEIEVAKTAAGAVAYANHFGVQAKEHGNAALAWFGVTALALAASVAVVIRYLADSAWRTAPAASSGSGVPPAVQPLAAMSTQGLILSLVHSFAYRVLLASLLIYAIVWCSRNYRANRHNEVIYRAREAAMNTFNAFIAGTEDRQIKDAVLLRAVEAAFATQPTGFLPSEPEAAPHALITELAEIAMKARRG